MTSTPGEPTTAPRSRICPSSNSNGRSSASSHSTPIVRHATCCRRFCIRRPRRPRPERRSASATLIPGHARTWYSSRPGRSEEHTSELQSLRHLVCRLLLEKKNKKKHQHTKASCLYSASHAVTRVGT